MNRLIGKKSPSFQAPAIVDGAIAQNFSLDDYLGKYVLFFFYPLDFTFVCPTELHAFQQALEEFEKRECQVIGCSVDSVYSHYAWLRTPRSKGGIEGVDYPLVSDLKKEISSQFGVLCEEEGVAFRGLFLLDKEGVIRHFVINDLPLGRNVAEAIRMLDALRHFEQFGEVCPANWNEGARSMKPTQEGLEKYCAV